MDSCPLQTVLMKINGGTIIPEFKMPKSSTILAVKEKIETFINVDVGRQTLKYKNEEMMNDKILTDYDIKFAAEIALEVSPLPGGPEFGILVKHGAQVAKVKVKETTLVGQLRATVGRIWDVPSNNATLYCRSVKLEDDNAPLSAYYVGEGSGIGVGIITPD